MSYHVTIKPPEIALKWPLKHHTLNIISPSKPTEKNPKLPSPERPGDVVPSQPAAEPGIRTMYGVLFKYLAIHNHTYIYILLYIMDKVDLVS